MQGLPVAAVNQEIRLNQIEADIARGEVGTCVARVISRPVELLIQYPHKLGQPHQETRSRQDNSRSEANRAAPQQSIHKGGGSLLRLGRSALRLTHLPDFSKYGWTIYHFPALRLLPPHFNVASQRAKLLTPVFFVLFKQPQTIPDDFTYGLVTTGIDLRLDEPIQVRRERDVSCDLLCCHETSLACMAKYGKFRAAESTVQIELANLAVHVEGDEHRSLYDLDYRQ